MKNAAGRVTGNEKIYKGVKAWTGLPRAVTLPYSFTYNGVSVQNVFVYFGIKQGEGVRMATEKFEHATFYLTQVQVNRIKQLAKENQISRSALVRMIIREYLAKQEEEKGSKKG